MTLEIRAPGPTSYEPLVRLRMERLPRQRRPQAEWPFVHAAEMPHFVTRAAYVDGRLVGWGSTIRGSWFPPSIALVNVTVARDHEGRGAGGALFRELLTTVPDGTTTLGTAVDDADPTSLEIAKGWGFEVTQHGIESELELTDLPEPSAPDGVTFEDVSSLEFPDEEAVEEMLRDSQTNPEAAEGFVSTLADYRRVAAKVQVEVAALARVDGAPAAIIVGEVEEGVLGIGYTGVGRAYRGRGLALGLKRYAHRLAAAAGATVCHTMNEEANVGIRHVNAQLGYRITGGMYRMRRPL